MTSRTGSQPAAGLRVATMNLWGTFGEWEQRRRVLAEGFAQLNPDLVTFAEAVKTPAYDQAADILPGHFQLAWHRLRETDGRGISVASRWPVKDVTELDLDVTSRTGGFARSALLAHIAVPDPIGAVLFVSYLPNWQPSLAYERELQAVLTARAIEEAAEGGRLHVILAGDLDADPESSSVRFWTGRQSLSGMSVCYRDAWESIHPTEPGHTFTPENPLHADWDWPFRRIDYIMVRCGEHGGPTLAIRDCRRIFGQPAGGVWASDHFGVAADLALPPGPDRHWH